MISDIPQIRQDETWLGGRLPLSLPMDPPREILIDLILDADTGVIKQLNLVEANAPVSEFSQLVREAIQNPRGEAPTSRPGRILVGELALFGALKKLSRTESFELILEPSVGEPLRETAAEIEAEMQDGPGYQYLAYEDVAPDLVKNFFTRVGNFIVAAPWQEIESTEILVLNGLECDPIFVSILGLGEIGLTVFLDTEALECILLQRGDPFEQNILSAVLESEPDIGLNSEIREHNWPTHQLGVPIVFKANREERPHPTEQELKLLCKVFEAITLCGETDFFETAVRTVVKLECGKTVTATFEESLFEQANSKESEAIEISLTHGQRNLVAELLPAFAEFLELKTKKRRKTTLPFDVAVSLLDHLNENIFDLRGHKLTAARGLRSSLSDELESFELDPFDFYDETELSEAEIYSRIEEEVSAFEKCREFKKYCDGRRRKSTVGLIFELGYQYLGSRLETFEEDDLEAVLLVYFPRKVVMDFEGCLDFMEELKAYFQFSKRTSHNPSAQPCLQYLNHPDFVKAFLDRMSDSDNFGMAKSLVSESSSPSSPSSPSSDMEANKSNRQKTRKNKNSKRKNQKASRKKNRKR